MAHTKRDLGELTIDLLVLSRFNRYNPLLATFAGVWATLLAGSDKIAHSQGQDVDTDPISPEHVLQQAILCFTCSFVFCGAGMVWNDWIDLHIDRQVARTKNRPLARGAVTTSEALLWMGAQYVASWFLVSWMLEGENVPAAMLPVTLSTILYPFAKRPIFRRLHIYPQYLLGFTLAYPSLIGVLAIKGLNQPLSASISESLPLAIFVFAWTLYLNTAYSYQDIEDDQKMGVNSAYVLAGSYIHYLLVLLAGLALGALGCQLAVQGSAWLWGSWMGVWLWSFLGQLGRFDKSRPESGGGLHQENFMLGVWTIGVCAVELVL
ncbi:UbiA prenyltransferase family-domain-containing protein [Aspergillus pseudoustus]|uniref:UbiA prenyltransferase family-domain-containing protein n=1 Tax=Aspergillus pseudoustus TaxID=1810923 RepID=A0ABR4K743_9EURO